MPQAKKPKLTAKQRGFVKDLILTKNGTEAARRNYNIGGKGGRVPDNTAATIASENIRKPQIRAVLKDHGLDESYLVENLKKRIEHGTNESAITKNIEIGLKLHGHLGNGPGTLRGGTLNIYQQFNDLKDPEVSQKVQEITQKLSEITQGGPEKDIIDTKATEKG